MSFLDKAKNAVEEFVGAAEENIGKAIGDKAMTADGEAREDAAEERDQEQDGPDGQDGPAPVGR